MSLIQNNASRRILVTLLAVVAVVLPCGLSGLLGNRRTEIDVNSGRMRTRVLMFSVVVSENESDTRFSRAIARNNLLVDSPDYRLVSSTSAGLQRFFGTAWEYSKFGDVPGVTEDMMRLFDLQPALQEREREIMARLTGWLQAGDVDKMREFVADLINTEPTE